jgi:glycosyltransferase involved in cell wall biosynthesis
MTYGIVIASYRYGHLAAHALESVICQIRRFDQILFVDDGVGDCGHLPAFYPEAEFLIRNQNMGTVENFRDALSRVKTDYVMFLGADNWIRPDTLVELKEAVEALSVNPDIVTYDIMVTGPNREEISKNYGHQMRYLDGDYYWDRSEAHHGSMLYKTRLAREVGGYEHNRTSDKTDEDLNLWNKMLKAGARVSHEKKGLLYYRRHRENFNRY